VLDVDRVVVEEVDDVLEVDEVVFVLLAAVAPRRTMLTRNCLKESIFDHVNLNVWEMC